MTRPEANVVSFFIDLLYDIKNIYYSVFDPRSGKHNKYFNK